MSSKSSSSSTATSSKRRSKRTRSNSQKVDDKSTIGVSHNKAGSGGNVIRLKIPRGAAPKDPKDEDDDKESKNKKTKVDKKQPQPKKKNKNNKKKVKAGNKSKPTPPPPTSKSSDMDSTDSDDEVSHPKLTSEQRKQIDKWVAEDLKTISAMHGSDSTRVEGEVSSSTTPRWRKCYFCSLHYDTHSLRDTTEHSLGSCTSKEVVPSSSSSSSSLSTNKEDKKKPNKKDSKEPSIELSERKSKTKTKSKEELVTKAVSSITGVPYGPDRPNWKEPVVFTINEIAGKLRRSNVAVKSLLHGPLESTDDFESIGDDNAAVGDMIEEWCKLNYVRVVGDYPTPWISNNEVTLKEHDIIYDENVKLVFALLATLGVSGNLIMLEIEEFIFLRWFAHTKVLLGHLIDCIHPGSPVALPDIVRLHFSPMEHKGILGDWYEGVVMVNGVMPREIGYDGDDDDLTRRDPRYKSIVEFERYGHVCGTVGDSEIKMSFGYNFNIRCDTCAAGYYSSENIHDWTPCLSGYKDSYTPGKPCKSWICNKCIEKYGRTTCSSCSNTCDRCMQPTGSRKCKTCYPPEQEY